MISALYAQAYGAYSGFEDVDVWDEKRDARLYPGPHPVVAHPPCKRWGRFFHGSPRKPHQFTLGDDGGCFAAAIASVSKWGGVLEHPADSLAWDHFGLMHPPRSGGWVMADWRGGWTCYVEQGFYGHPARKATWLLAYGCDLPSLRWGKGKQRLDPVVLARHGYETARRRGIVSMAGGKRKEAIRDESPAAFRDVLLAMARSAAR